MPVRKSLGFKGVGESQCNISMNGEELEDLKGREKVVCVLCVCVR